MIITISDVQQWALHERIIVKYDWMKYEWMKYEWIHMKYEFVYMATSIIADNGISEL